LDANECKTKLTCQRAQKEEFQTEQLYYGTFGYLTNPELFIVKSIWSIKDYVMVKSSRASPPLDMILWVVRG